MSFTAERLRTLDDILGYWPLFYSGLQDLNKLIREEKQITPEKFFNMILKTVMKGDDLGHVAVFHNDTETGVGFSVTFGISDDAAFVYALSTKRMIAGLRKFMQNHIEAWARNIGYKELQCSSPRINGSGMALFEKAFGFKRWLLHYYKPL